MRCPRRSSSCCFTDKRINPAIHTEHNEEKQRVVVTVPPSVLCNYTRHFSSFTASSSFCLFSFNWRIRNHMVSISGWNLNAFVSRSLKPKLPDLDSPVLICAVMKRARLLSNPLDGNLQVLVHWFVQSGQCDAAARLQTPVTASLTALGAKLNHSRQQNVPEWQVYSVDGAATGSVADSQCGTFPG